MLSMPFQDGWDMICFAQNAEYEDRLWLRWALRYQEYMNFDAFKAFFHGEMEDSRTEEEILGIVKKIIG